MSITDRHSQDYVADIIENLLDNKKDARILDVAAGTGIAGQSVSILTLLVCIP